MRDGAGNVTRWFGSNTDVQDLRDAQQSLAFMNAQLEARVQARTGELLILNDDLRQLASQLALAQRITLVGSWSMDARSHRVEWSDELFRIMGLPLASSAPPLTAQQEWFSAESWSRLREAVERALRTGESYELDLQVTCPGGQSKRTIARAQALRDNDGNVAKLIGTLQDVTELWEARRERDSAAERARLATSAAGAGVWDWNVREDVLVWDERMCSLHGTTTSSFPGTYDAWLACVHTDDRAATADAIAGALSGTTQFDTSFRVVFSDGSVRHIRGSAQVHRDQSGAPTRMIGVNWDVTEQHQLMLALRSNEVLLKQFVRHAPAAIAMLDREMRYLQASEQWIRDYKLAGQELGGRSHYEVFPDIPERWKQVHCRVLGGAIEGCAEDPFPRAAGGTEWLQWEARPWLLPDGSIGGLIFFTQVITARKELELLLHSQKRDLERSNRDLEQFAYAASHDLQEPLRAVAGCAQILERNYRDKLDGSADQLIQHIVGGAERMRALIHDLLSYARVGTHGAHLRPVASALAVQQAIANLSAPIDESRASIEVGELPRVRADPAQLAQLFQNLIGNGLKYRSTRPLSINISAARDGEQWVFSVQDNGIGIDSDYFERIFVLFQRLHTRDEYPGTGIGLALCKKIVERHGGIIWVESELGKGASFMFSLPGEA